MLMAMDVPVKCRRCGKTAPASEFSIDPDYKMAVCRSCVKSKGSMQNNKPAENTPRPASWNKYSEKVEKDVFEKTTGKIMKKCGRCNYNYKYDPTRNFPNKCPFCGR